MSPQGSGRKTVTYALVALVIIVTALFAYYYFESQSSLSQKDQQIASLESSLRVQQLNATRLQQAGEKVNETIASLISEISTLRTNQSASQLRLSELTAQLSALRNQSALYSVEAGLIYQITGIDSVQLFVNATMTFHPNSTTIVGAGSGGSNWTLAFLSPGGCPVTSIQQLNQTSLLIKMVVNSAGKDVTSDFASIGPQPSTLEFVNSGQASVECHFSMYMVANT